MPRRAGIINGGQNRLELFDCNLLRVAVIRDLNIFPLHPFDGIDLVQDGAIGLRPLQKLVVAGNSAQPLVNRRMTGAILFQMFFPSGHIKGCYLTEMLTLQKLNQSLGCPIVTAAGVIRFAFQPHQPGLPIRVGRYLCQTNINFL